MNKGWPGLSLEVWIKYIIHMDRKKKNLIWCPCSLKMGQTSLRFAYEDVINVIKTIITRENCTCRRRSTAQKYVPADCATALHKTPCSHARHLQRLTRARHAFQQTQSNLFFDGAPVWTRSASTQILKHQILVTTITKLKHFLHLLMV